MIKKARGRIFIYLSSASVAHTNFLIEDTESHLQRL